MDLTELYSELRKGAIQGARALLGWKFVHDSPVGKLSGYIVETEAYHQDDPASHTYRGLTTRNAPMFEEAGTVYVYFTYGMHYCVNIVCGEKGRGEAVLIRALEPLDGIEIMKEKRGVNNLTSLSNGPAKLVQAMGIQYEQSGSVIGTKLHLEKGFTPESVTQSTRVGITKAKDQPWRFYITGNSFVSKK
jgi:DNA-3-methyladenine glycosylase